MSTDIVPLTSTEINVVNYVEQYWHRKNEFPPVGNLKGKFPDLNVGELLKHPTFNLSMLNRGIVVPDTSLPDELTREQVAAALKYLDINDTRSLTSKLKEIGLSTTQWYGWMKQPAFKNFVQGSMTKDFDENLHVAQQGLMKAIDRGETHAIKFYYELTGRHNGDTNNIGNIKVVLAQIIETIQRHVKDPDVLRAISQDFDVILGGGKVETTAREADLKRLL